MMTPFEDIAIGQEIVGRPFTATKATIREFCEASLDYNPLHLEDAYMEGSFGKTKFGGVIMHGMTNFGLLSAMLTDWALDHGGEHRRLETRWRAPVRPGDIVTPRARIIAIETTLKARFVVLEVEIRKADGDLVATGEAMVEF